MRCDSLQKIVKSPGVLGLDEAESPFPILRLVFGPLSVRILTAILCLFLFFPTEMVPELLPTALPRPCDSGILSLSGPSAGRPVTPGGNSQILPPLNFLIDASREISSAGTLSRRRKCSPPFALSASSPLSATATAGRRGGRRSQRSNPKVWHPADDISCPRHSLTL
jgi:hypothetical protein